MLIELLFVLKRQSQFFPEEKVVLTGNPRASEVMKQGWHKGKAFSRAKYNNPAVLIFGGSRGARPINEAVVKVINGELAKRPYQIIIYYR